MKLTYTETKSGRVTDSKVIGEFKTFGELADLMEQEIDTCRKYEAMDAANKLSEWINVSVPLQFTYYDGSIGTWRIMF